MLASVLLRSFPASNRIPVCNRCPCFYVFNKGFQINCGPRPPSHLPDPPMSRASLPLSGSFPSDSSHTPCCHHTQNFVPTFQLSSSPSSSPTPNSHLSKAQHDRAQCFLKDNNIHKADFQTWKCSIRGKKKRKSSLLGVGKIKQQNSFSYKVLTIR